MKAFLQIINFASAFTQLKCLRNNIVFYFYHCNSIISLQFVITGCFGGVAGHKRNGLAVSSFSLLEINLVPSRNFLKN